MADPKNTPTPTPTSPGDGAPTTDAAPADPIPSIETPSAGTEPAAQVASATAKPVPPPLPAEYEMPDDYATESWVDQAKAWAEANPVLAVLAAAGAGLVVGRIVTGLVPDSEPATLTDRIETRAKSFKKQARKQSKLYQKEAGKATARYKKDALAFADGAGDTVSESLHRAADALREAAGSVGSAASEGYEKSRDLADTVSDAVKVAVTGVLAKKVDDWVDRVKR